LRYISVYRADTFASRLLHFGYWLDTGISLNLSRVFRNRGYDRGRLEISSVVTQVEDEKIGRVKGGGNEVMRATIDK